jgi:hypothetical protein
MQPALSVAQQQKQAESGMIGKQKGEHSMSAQSAHRVQQELEAHRLFGSMLVGIVEDEQGFVGLAFKRGIIRKTLWITSDTEGNEPGAVQVTGGGH